MLVFAATLEPSIYNPETADAINDWMTKCCILVSLLSTVDDVHAVLADPDLVKQHLDTQHNDKQILHLLDQNDCLPPLKGEYWLDDSSLSSDSDDSTRTS